MLGIDVSKDTLACTLLDPQTQKPIWNRTVPNTTAGINRLLRQTPDQSHWVLEPTGRYGLLAATTARQAGRQVLLAQPKKARDFLRSIALSPILINARTAITAPILLKQCPDLHAQTLV